MWPRGNVSEEATGVKSFGAGSQTSGLSAFK